MFRRFLVTSAIRVAISGVLVWLASAFLLSFIGFAIAADETPVSTPDGAWYRGQAQRASNIALALFVLTGGGAVYLLLTTGLFAGRLHRVVRAVIASVLTGGVTFGLLLLSSRTGRSGGPVAELAQVISIWIRRLI